MGAPDDVGSRPAPSPWLGMWPRPRRTVRALLETDPKRDVLLLAALAGVADAWSFSAHAYAGDRFATSDIVIVGAVGGALGGVLGLFVWGWLIVVAGRWLGGAATPRQARAAVAWGNVPTAWTLPVQMFAIWLFGREQFAFDQPHLEQVESLALAYTGLAAVMTAMGFWSFVTLCLATAEAQGFGPWKGLANVVAVLLAFLIVGAALLFLAVNLGLAWGLTIRAL